MLVQFSLGLDLNPETVLQYISSPDSRKTYYTLKQFQDFQNYILFLLYLFHNISLYKGCLENEKQRRVCLFNNIHSFQ